MIFTYVALNGRLRLAQIKDAQQSLVDINWTALSHVDSQTSPPDQVHLAVWPGQHQSYSLFLLKEQGLFTQVSQHDHFDTTRCRAGTLCQLAMTTGSADLAAPARRHQRKFYLLRGRCRAAAAMH
ncbi:hypothetical protein SGGMMB4_01821 [Sodalis glossinidius str. 'morsitans']|uniref:Uncharacterized protein n=1 Tax=Sodalis glossinidius (strain morsitans) TaxID=343509 RepID=A0A193QHH1_SODGM|nr:hypothetical protein [Sodalis glossinidius]CRL44624.1 hypothetical protein SGGMMB4_01821 [Sodalis glossinidius str. 'morsitans']